MSRVGDRMRRGSLQFWPRKRAKRIYPRVNWRGTARAAGSEAKLLGFPAWKSGSTHVAYVETNAESPSSGKTVSKNATILDAPSILAVGIRYYTSTGNGLKASGEEWFSSIPKELELERKTLAGKKQSSGEAGAGKEELADVRLLVATQPRKSGMHKKKPDLLEIGIGGDAGAKAEYAKSLLGKEIAASDVFSPGEYADASAVTKASGFSGPVKRFGIRIQGRKDKKRQRHPGSMGSTVPRKMDWRVPQAGQFGFFTRTEHNKRILLIDRDAKKVNQKGGILGYGLAKAAMLVEGSLPGAQKRLVVLRKAMRKKAKVPVALDYISTESKQKAR